LKEILSQHKIRH